MFFFLKKAWLIMFGLFNICISFATCVIILTSDKYLYCKSYMRLANLVPFHARVNIVYFIGLLDTLYYPHQRPNTKKNVLTIEL